VCFKSETQLDLLPDGGVQNPAPPLAPLAPAYAQRWVQNAVERSWNTIANVRFEDFSVCPTDPKNTKTYVVVFLLDELTSSMQGGGSGGKKPLALPQDIKSRSQAAIRMTTSPLFQNRKRIEYLAVHEFGHVLGFAHEHIRQDHDQVAIEAGAPTVPLTYLTATYDADSIMNYLHSERSGSGMLTDLDVMGAQAFYAPNPSQDDDRDAVSDRRDNCPYASNHDQVNSNLDAEVALARRNGFPSDDGHVPTPSDTQAYVDRWQKTYRGDACDPTPIVRATLSTAVATSTGNTCATSATTWSTTAALRFEGVRGDAVGARREALAADLELASPIADRRHELLTGLSR
jgi:hypothetical protein